MGGVCVCTGGWCVGGVCVCVSVCVSVCACVCLSMSQDPHQQYVNAVTFLSTCSTTEPTRSVIGRQLHADSSYGS